MWAVIPVGVAEDEAETCRRLASPPRCLAGCGSELTKRNAEIGDEAPAEHLESCQLSLMCSLLPCASSISPSGAGQRNWRPLGQLIARNSYVRQ